MLGEDALWPALNLTVLLGGADEMDEKVILAQPRGGDRTDADKFASSYVSYQEGRLDGTYEATLPTLPLVAPWRCSSVWI